MVPPRRFLDRLRRGARRRGHGSRSKSGPISTTRDAARVRESSPTCSSATTPQPSGPTSPRSPTRTARSPIGAGCDSSRCWPASSGPTPRSVDRAIATRHAAHGDGGPAGRRTRAARRAHAARGAPAPAVHRPRRRREVPRRPPRRRAARSPAIPRSAPRTRTALTEVGNELQAQLAMLFDVGLLELRRITWDAPAALLEKLIEYEAVHTIELVGRPEEPARLRPPVLRVLPSRDARRAARVRRDRADDRHAVRARSPARRARARPRPRSRRHRGVLFDLELPARPRGREPRHRAHRAGRRAAAPRPARSSSTS